MLVRDVKTDSAAAQAGLQPGDVILEAAHRMVTTPEDLRQAVERQPSHTPLMLRVHRRGGNLYVAVPV